FDCPGYGIAVVESDPKCRDFAKSILPRIEKASVLALTGTGDPTGICLFDDHRNLDRTKHWPFDPARVGEDPHGEMPRLLAPALAALKLKRPILLRRSC